MKEEIKFPTRQISRYCWILEEENKRLKEDLSLVIKERDDNIKQNKKLKSDVSVYKSQMNAYKEKYLALLKANTELVEENRKLKESLDIATKCSSKEEDWIIKLSEENKKLREENKKLREENEMLRCNKGWTPEKVWHEEMIQYLMEENKKLKDELEFYKKQYKHTTWDYIEEDLYDLDC